jgi:hypothetical protein
MKEYKVVAPKLGLRNRNQNLEDLLNSYSREGWTFTSINESQTLVIFERNKNR